MKSSVVTSSAEAAYSVTSSWSSSLVYDINKKNGKC